MRKLLLFLFLSSYILGIGQVKDPVKWTFTSKKLSTGNYEVSLTAKIEPGWHIYSQTTPEGGPIPTSVSFSKNPLITLEGNVREIGKLEQKHENIFDVDVKQFSNKVVFVQKVKVKGIAKTTVTGGVEYMVCDDKQCLPPKTVKFSVALN